MAEHKSIPAAEVSLARESLRIERIQAYTRFIDCFVPMIGARAAAEPTTQLDPDLENARDLALTAAFDAIRAEALRDVAAANARGKEASDARSTKAGEAAEA